MMIIIKDPKKLDELYQKAKYQGELEGHVFTDEDEKIIKAVASGKMTREELIKMHKQKES